MKNEIERKAVINRAEKLFRKYTDLSAEDSLVIALEEFDTGYDLSTEEYNELIAEVKGDI